MAGRAGLSSEATTWDAWRNEDGRWTVQMAWQAGLSDNVAHFRFSPARTAAPSPRWTTRPTS